MSYYENNIAAIRKMNPDLYKMIEERGIEDRVVEVDCFSQETRDGSSVIGIHIDDRKYYMGSRYNPSKEAENFAQKYADVGDYSIMLFFGLGSGLIAKKIISILGGHVLFLFYTDSPTLPPTRDGAQTATKSARAHLPEF